MAVGLPAISTNINGIPELLEQDFLISVGDIDDLASKILKLIENKNLYENASQNNITRARKYCVDELQKRRNHFYSKLRKCVKTEDVTI